MALPTRAIAALLLALFAILVSACAGTGCEEWGTRVESVKVCGPKGTNCTFQDQPVQYCARTSSERAVSAPAPGGKESRASAPRPKEDRQQTRAPEEIAKPGAIPSRPEREREAPAPTKIGKADKTGMPDLTPFWQSLFSASRYPGIRYGKVKRATMSPTTAPASSPRIEAALKTRVRSVISMQVASDSRFTPMDHRLDAVVYRAHNRDAAVALYNVMVRDESRDKTPGAHPGVTLTVVKTDDKNKSGGSGQRIYLQRGSYVVEVDEWKSVYRDAAGKPVPGEQFPHTRPISPTVVAKAATQTFSAE